MISMGNAIERQLCPLINLVINHHDLCRTWAEFVTKAKKRREEIEKLGKERDIVIRQLEQMRSEFEPMRAEKERLRAEFAEQNAIIHILEDSLSASNSEQKQTNTQLASVEAECVKLRQLLEEERGECKKKEKETFALTREREELFARSSRATDR